VWSLIFTGNLLALIILIVLMLMSVLSWTVIVTKWLQLRATAAENRHFYSVYTRDQPLSNLYSMAQKFGASPLARMFEVSYREIGSFRQQLEQAGGSGGGGGAAVRERLMTNLGRSLERTYNQQNLRLENWLPTLAIVSSASPYIGLFGTVLGIIDAFAGIGTTGVTSLAVVAPGISEALVATAAGLMAAIPALIAYNIYRNRLRELNTQMKNFALDVSNRLERLL
jgi:biopolymer transport protein TolQ